MSSYEDQQQPTSRLDALERERKRQQMINDSMDWRHLGTNSSNDNDSFRELYQMEKERQIQMGKQQLTRQEIDERIERQKIIQVERYL